MVAANSEIRIEEVIRNIQETLEDVAQTRHLMWKRRLRAMAKDGTAGIDLPASVLAGLETRGADVSSFLVDGRLTADLLEGAFRFKPKGSVETASLERMRVDFNQSLQALAQLSQANPMVAAILQSPGAAKALLAQWVRLYRVQDKQAFLGSEAQALMRPMMMPGQPGMPTSGQPAAMMPAQAPGSPAPVMR